MLKVAVALLLRMHAVLRSMLPERYCLPVIRVDTRRHNRRRYEASRRGGRPLHARRRTMLLVLLLLL